MLFRETPPEATQSASTSPLRRRPHNHSVSRRAILTGSLGTGTLGILAALTGCSTNLNTPSEATARRDTLPHPPLRPPPQVLPSRARPLPFRSPLQRKTSSKTGRSSPARWNSPTNTRASTNRPAPPPRQRMYPNPRRRFRPAPTPLLRGLTRRYAPTTARSLAPAKMAGTHPRRRASFTRRITPSSKRWATLRSYTIRAAGIRISSALSLWSRRNRPPRLRVTTAT